jgi:hypothetical protein
MIDEYNIGENGKWREGRSGLGTYRGLRDRGAPLPSPRPIRRCPLLSPVDSWRPEKASSKKRSIS